MMALMLQMKMRETSFLMIDLEKIFKEDDESFNRFQDALEREFSELELIASYNNSTKMLRISIGTLTTQVRIGDIT